MASGGHSVTAVVFSDMMKHTLCIYFSDKHIKEIVFTNATPTYLLHGAESFLRS
jgi:hypothetical protein